jgi:threonine dehydratase
MTPILNLSQIKSARNLLKGVAYNTSLRTSQTFSRLTEQEIYFKCENLQRTGSFKIRGALNFIHHLSAQAKARGVAAASAGNHAQGVALAAAGAKTNATIVMPLRASLAKITATKGYGARVILYGETFDEAKARAKELAQDKGLTFIPAFDHPRVIAGQGTIALEILEALPDCRAIIVPVGGGGLIAGIAYAAKHVNPKVKILGVQAQGAAAVVESLKKGKVVSLSAAATLADGIAVKTPGKITFPLISKYVDEVVTVDDEEIASAILLLLERSKMLVEGAGAAGVAALMYNKFKLAPRQKTAVLISGGNIDINILSRIVEKGLVKSGRYLRLQMPLVDRPGALKELLEIIARAQANILSIYHDRLDPTLPIERVEVIITVEVRDHEHGSSLIKNLEGRGYEVRRALSL